MSGTREAIIGRVGAGKPPLTCGQCQVARETIGAHGSVLYLKVRIELTCLILPERDQITGTDKLFRKVEHVTGTVVGQFTGGSTVAQRVTHRLVVGSGLTHALTKFVARLDTGQITSATTNDTIHLVIVVVTLPFLLLHIRTHM